MDTQGIVSNNKALTPKYSAEAANEVVEDQAKKIPNLVFMGLAGASIAGSIYLALRAGKKTDVANFVGHWAPVFLLLGIYNKIVKVENELLRDSRFMDNLH